MTTAVIPAAGGSISPTSGAYYLSGTAVNLTATPAAGYIFSSWSGPVANINSASATIAMNAPQTVTASFVSALSVAPSSVGFGTVYLASATNGTLTVTNKGTTPISFGNAQIKMVSAGSSSQFALNNPCPHSLAGGSSCTITIAFTAGAYYTSQTASLIVSDDAPDSPQTVTLNATVIDPEASLNPSKLAFNTSVNTAATQSVTLTNPGATALSITGMTITGPDAPAFTVNSNCGSSLLAGASCTINVVFTPLSKAKFSAVLNVADNAQSGTQTVALSGTGH